MKGLAKYDYMERQHFLRALSLLSMRKNHIIMFALKEIHILFPFKPEDC